MTIRCGSYLGTAPKYKDHLGRLQREGWNGLNEKLRESHRADLHQALAYALLADKPQVDTFLVYPRPADSADQAFAVANLTTGDRNVRVILAAIPFGFVGPDQRMGVLKDWENRLRLTG